MPNLELEIIEVNVIDGGIEVFARAWENGNQIGFGVDGSVDIERFRIFNPPILVPDPLGDIISIPSQDDSGITYPVSIFREDVEEATLQSITHTISVMKNKYDSSRIIAGKRGNTTSTFYPAAGAASPVDGGLEHSTSPETWTTTRDAATATLVRVTNTTDNFSQGEYFAGGTRYIITRIATCFDTSTIPDTDAISSATISYYSLGSGDTTNGDSASVVAVTLASSSNLVSGDYAKANWGTTEFATRQSLSTLNSVGYKDFALNASGISNVNKTGISYFGSRSGNDLDNTTPTQRGYVPISTADNTGTTQDPKLVVEHAAPVANTGFFNFM